MSMWGAVLVISIGLGACALESPESRRERREARLASEAPVEETTGLEEEPVAVVEVEVEPTAPPKRTIVRHLDVATLISLGMTAAEVEALIGDPGPPWLKIDLVPWEESDTIQLIVPLEDESKLDLTMERVESGPTHYAFIFFPEVGVFLVGSGVRAPAYVFFDVADDRVIAVQSVFCDHTTRHFELVGLAIPETSSCQ